jgi:SAM-dependent methyltransferase
MALKQTARRIIGTLPWLGPAALGVLRAVRRRTFPGSRDYWEARYARGGTSGPGSQGELAAFKAEVLNAFVREQGVASVIEFGCGDGQQLALADYPAYLGLDVSPTAIRLCRERFRGDARKRFALYDPERHEPGDPAWQADLALSLDVIFHLTEERAFQLYLQHLFAAARRFVVIYSSDAEDTPPGEPAHVRNRRFSAWVEARQPGWRLLRRLPNRYPYRGDAAAGSVSDFFFYGRA